MTANEPSRQQEAANHGDAEFLDEAIVRASEQVVVDFGVSGQSERAPFYTFEESLHHGLLTLPRCKGSSQLLAPGVPLQTFHSATSTDRSSCAKSSVVVQKPPVWISVSALARLRRWTRRPPLWQRDALEFAQHRVPDPRDS